MASRTRRRYLGALTLLLISVESHAARIDVSITGLEKDLQSAALANLSLDAYRERDVSAGQVKRLFGMGTSELRKALEPYGYYSVDVVSDLRETAAGYQALFKVTLGQPVLVREVAVSVDGEGAQVPAVHKAIAAFAPRRGERFDHQVYEQSKGAISVALADAGYLQAQVPRHRVEVERRTRSARIDLSWQSGPRFRFGPVRFSAVQFPDTFLERFISWHEGEYYSGEQLKKLQQRLVDAGYFSSVLVQSHPEAAVDMAVPIEVSLLPAKRTLYTGSLYFTTDTGLGVDVAADRRWLSPRGDKLKTDLNVAELQQDLSLAYRVPLFGRHERTRTFGAAYGDKVTDTSDSQTLRLGVNESRKWHGFTRTLGIQFLAGDFEVGGETGHSNLIYAEGALTRKEADDLFLPRHGYSLNFALRLGPQTSFTDTDLAQLTADASWIRAFRERQWLILRTSLGATAVGNFDELPPELRFFAGGDRSIRGFDYQSLGSVNADGEVIGGTFLAVASVEYEYRIWRNWGIATFIDGGDAFRTPQFALNVGAGIGLRWKSPVGILRLDVATPVKSSLGHGVRIHFSIGSSL